MHGTGVPGRQVQTRRWYFPLYLTSGAAGELENRPHGHHRGMPPDPASRQAINKSTGEVQLCWSTLQTRGSDTSRGHTHSLRPFFSPTLPVHVHLYRIPTPQEQVCPPSFRPHRGSQLRKSKGDTGQPKRKLRKHPQPSISDLSRGKPALCRALIQDWLLHPRCSLRESPHGPQLTIKIPHMASCMERRVAEAEVMLSRPAQPFISDTLPE